jgi:CheY-like chemotaxis protein
VIPAKWGSNCICGLRLSMPELGSGAQMKAKTMGAAAHVGSQVTNSPVILLVEDEPIVREVTRDVLRHAGYAVLEAGSPGEALHMATEHAGRIDLLLTDVVMPEMNGVDLAQRLQSAQANLITVFMSGYAEGELALKIRRASAVHIQKPFTMEVLLTRVAEALHASSAV